MALSRRSHRYSTSGDYWPGFVDAMATLLLVMTFLLSMFMITQYFVTQESSGKDNALSSLNRQISQLTELLALERSKQKSLEETVTTLTATLSNARSENSRLQGLISAAGNKGQAADARVSALTSELEAEKKLSAEARSQVAILNQQLAELRRQIAALNAALEASEARDKASRETIINLGQRLNVALAKKVQELAQFRSDFFGKLLKILRKRSDVRVVGDRFVFQTEVLFPSGSADISLEGLPELDKLADALHELSREIPPDIDWVLRVDGHTDDRPIASAAFPSNWELSAARAISVVRYLISRGIPPNRLVAAGFGEHHPLVRGDSDEARARNRRIELKLTQK